MSTPARPAPDREYTGTVYVTLETAGQKFTSGVGPLPSEQAWSLFRSFLRDLHKVRPRKTSEPTSSSIPDATGHP